MIDRPIKLMIPGPIQPDPAVMDAMGSPVVPHYGTDWRDYYNETVALLKHIFNTQGDVFIMVGAGTTAIDACIGSALSTGEKIIVGINGFFSERMKTVAEYYGLEVVTVTAEWGKPLHSEDYAEAFRQHPDAVAATAVHLETSTSVVNPVEEIGPIVRRHGAVFIVDAVSSLGGMDYYMDEWGIDMCASATQKCLGAPPGLAPVAVGERGWEAIDRNPAKGHGFYTNLAVWREYAKKWDWHPFPVTMAVNNVIALRTSLDQLLEEGIKNRLERYRQLAIYLRAEIRRIGLQLFTTDAEMSPVITAVLASKSLSVDHLMQYLEGERRIKIAPGLGVLAGKIFRIGHMSPVVNKDDIDELVEALDTYLKHTQN